MIENEKEFYKQWAEEALIGNEYYRKLVLRANKHIDRDTILSLRGTKAIKIESMMNTDDEYDNRESWGELIPKAEKRQKCSVDITTWSSLVRNALDILKPQLEYVLHTFGSYLFKSTFATCLDEIIKLGEFKPNVNFPMRLFKEAEETDLIKSSVYLNNKNHLLKIMTDEDGIDWYVCAVYTGEIIWVLEALLDTIYSLLCDMGDGKDIGTRPHHTLVLTYINREDLADNQNIMDENEAKEVQDEIDEIDNELERLQMSKEVLRLQGKVAQMHSLAMEIYDDIETLQEKYGLMTMDDIFKINK